MVKPQNLNKSEWSKVLKDGINVENLSNQLRNGQEVPWSKTLREYTSDSKEILDLGSGRGELSASLAMKGKRTTLFDWSGKNLQFSRKLYDTLGIDGNFVKGDMTKSLPFDNKSFDTVFSCGVFEYFNDEQITKIIDEIKRVARKRIIILVPNSRSIAYRIGKWYMEIIKKWQWGGERPFSSLKKYFGTDKKWKITEMTVGTKHSMRFLLIPGGRTIQNFIQKIFRLRDHSKPSSFNQGYILITIGEVT